MRRNKVLFVSFVVLLGVTPGFSAASGTPTSVSHSWHFQPQQDHHVITGVPYVAQTEVNYCLYACLTMILNYLGRNTSLNELLFYGGGGYSHSYRADGRLPHSDMWRRFEFIHYLFGITEQPWRPLDNNQSHEERWDQYYTRVKENITHDIPVVTLVDPFSLPSLRAQFRATDVFWKMMLPPGHHVIVVLGFNETNQSICYHDPNAGFYGNGSYGDSAWMTMEEFRQAHETINSYYLITYEHTGTPLSKPEAFDEAFRKNIENLTGGLMGDEYYGLNASQQMQFYFSQGTNQSQVTGRLYKRSGGTGVNYLIDLTLQRLGTLIDPIHPNIFDIIMAGKPDPFYGIAAAKNHTAEYLKQSVIHPSLCKNQSALLRNESEKWYDLSACYKIFQRRGMFLLNARAGLILHKMETLTNNIIHIEETLITQTRNHYPVTQPNSFS